MFLHWGCAKNFLFGSTFEKCWPFLRDYAIPQKKMSCKVLVATKAKIHTSHLAANLCTGLVRAGFFFVSKGPAWRLFSCRTPYVHPTAKRYTRKWKSEVICFLYDAETLERKMCLVLLIIYIYISSSKKSTTIYLKEYFVFPAKKRSIRMEFSFSLVTTPTTTQKAGVCNNDCIGDT